MSRWFFVSILVLTMLATTSAAAAPRHDFCADVGNSFAFGVSSYGSLRDWAPEAKSQHAADFRFLYVYILAGGMADPDNFKHWYVTPFVEAAKGMDAAAVLTFYQLLDLGRAAGHGGSEAEVVQQAIADPSVMRTYFDNFIWLLQVAEELGPPIVIHVEPDSWGFMMWAMGVEGNDDPTSVSVSVASSGHADVAGFADHAAGLGNALVGLREKYAPAVRLGWHASNFRVGTRPEVVTSFYSQMGDWDLLVGEHPHVEPEGGSWWDPWDEDRIAINLTWMSTLTHAAQLPLLLWQEPIGVDFHLIDDPADTTMLQRFAEAGAVGLLFEHIAHAGENDPDTIRASGMFGEIPPGSSTAGGTAADMRARVAAYAAAPLPWPTDSICDIGVTTGDPEVGGGGGGTTPNAAAQGDEAEGGCGCRLTGAPDAGRGWWVLAVALAWLMRRRRH